MNGKRTSDQRIDEMMRWGRYWKRSPGNGAVDFGAIHTQEDVAQARRFCRVFWEGQQFCDATDTEILAVAEGLRHRNQVCA